MSHSALYLTFPNNSQLAVTVSLTEDGLLVQGISRPDINFTIVGWPRIQELISPAPRRQTLTDAVLRMTPLDVVRYFAQSPILAIYTEDVRTAVLSHSEAAGGDFQLSQDLEAVRGLVGASQADIAERLFGDRTKTGGSYRRRILAVQNATTTNQAGLATPAVAKKAA
jgi:hypothetical protein